LGDSSFILLFGQSIIFCSELKTLHDGIRAQAVAWFNAMAPEVKTNISTHYGAMPR
jgi:hypothetical protein